MRDSHHAYEQSYVGSLVILHDAHEQWDALELCSASGSWRPRLLAIYLDPGPG